MVERHRNYDLILEKIAQNYHSPDAAEKTDTVVSATAEELAKMLKVIASPEPE